MASEKKEYSPAAKRLLYEMKVLADEIKVQQKIEREGNVEGVWYKTRDARHKIDELTKKYNTFANKYRKLRAQEDNMTLL